MANFSWNVGGLKGMSISINVHKITKARPDTHGDGYSGHSWVNITFQGGDIILHVPREAADHAVAARKIADAINETVAAIPPEAA